MHLCCVGRSELSGCVVALNCVRSRVRRSACPPREGFCDLPAAAQQKACVFVDPRRPGWSPLHTWGGSGSGEARFYPNPF